MLSNFIHIYVCVCVYKIFLSKYFARLIDFNFCECISFRKYSLNHSEPFNFIFCHLLGYFLAVSLFTVLWCWLPAICASGFAK